MDYIVKAKELGLSVINSDAFINYDRLKNEITSQGLSEDVALLENAIKIEQKFSSNKDSKFYLDAMEIIKKYNDNKLIQDYLKYKKEYADMLFQINQILEHFTGVSSEKNCSGCSGCGKNR